jgi:hypothetical protein
VGLKLNGTHQLLAYADDVNLLGDSKATIRKNTEPLIDASKEVGLQINIDKTKYMLLSRHQDVGQNHNKGLMKMWQMQINVNGRNKSEFDSGGN